MSRIKLAPPVPCTDSVTDRVQRRLGDAVTAVIASPVLDCQLVTVPLQAVSSTQVVLVPHQLGRPSVGIVAVSSTAMIGEMGLHRPVSTTQSTVMITTPDPVVGATVTLLVF